MLTHRVDSLQEIASGIRFHNISFGARIQGLSHHLRRIVLSNEQNLKIGSLPLSLNHTACFQAVHSRHSDIEHHNVGLQTLDLL
jgi:hypothetical protein